MTDPIPLASTIAYRGAKDSASWEGRVVGDAARFEEFLRRVVQPRVADDEAAFDADLRALATTGMGTEHVGRVLRSAPIPQTWEIGEAIAECVLRQDWGRDVVWPWNLVRDRRTPRASLPGADLVGFLREGADVLLLFGEVKTSSDATAPPNVMYGSGGMTWQLDDNATNLAIHLSLLKWLHARCRDESLRGLYKAATKRYLASGGKAMALVGVLVRDTAPNELDLGGRGAALSDRLRAPTSVALAAWYLPRPIAALPKLMKGSAP